MKASIVAAISALVLAAAPASYAAPAEGAGATLYRRYCGACHGREGKGDGFVAPALNQQPTDLTQLAKQNDGTFPFERTVRAIDGASTVRAHGVSEMPVWGEVFSERSEWPVERHIDARGKIILITEYLRAIQAR